MKKLALIIFCLLIISILAYSFKTKVFKKTQQLFANSASIPVSTDSDWNSGTSTNLSISNGSISINNKFQQQVDLTGKTVTSSEPIPGYNTEGPAGVIAGVPWGPLGSSFYWQVDLGEPKNLGRAYADFLRNSISFQVNLSASNDGSSWESVGDFTLPGWDVDPEGGPTTTFIADIGPLERRYWRFSGDVPSGEFMQGVGFYLSSAGKHVQPIDGGENFWKWDSNTIAQTVPANTSTAYRYRTSANGSDWTAWVGDIGSVTSRTGDDSNNPTRYRYLQVEATLTNTDGISTPQIDQYDIGYHVEQKPNAPSAQTAVVQ